MHPSSSPITLFASFWGNPEVPLAFFTQGHSGINAALAMRELGLLAAAGDDQGVACVLLTQALQLLIRLLPYGHDEVSYAAYSTRLHSFFSTKLRSILTAALSSVGFGNHEAAGSNVQQLRSQLSAELGDRASAGWTVCGTMGCVKAGGIVSFRKLGGTWAGPAHSSHSGGGGSGPCGITAGASRSFYEHHPRWG